MSTHETPSDGPAVDPADARELSVQQALRVIAANPVVAIDLHELVGATPRLDPLRNSATLVALILVVQGQLVGQFAYWGALKLNVATITTLVVGAVALGLVRFVYDSFAEHERRAKARKLGDLIQPGSSRPSSRGRVVLHVYDWLAEAAPVELSAPGTTFEEAIRRRASRAAVARATAPGRKVTET